MTYNNSAKDCLRAGFLTGFLFGLGSMLVYVIIGDVQADELQGIAFLFLFISLLFSLILALVLLLQSLKAQKAGEAQYDYLCENKIIYCDGIASIERTSGWLFLTDQALEFYPTNYKHFSNAIILPFNEILRWQAKNNRLELVTRIHNGTQTILLGVHSPQDWAEEMHRIINTINEKTAT